MDIHMAEAIRGCLSREGLQSFGRGKAKATEG